MLDEKSSLFKNLKKREVLNYHNRLFVNLKHKPNIGEVISLHDRSVCKEKNPNLYQYLNNRKIFLCLRITDLCQSTYILNEKGFSILQLKCTQENHKNW
jgi:hypothetical protein